MAKLQEASKERFIRPLYDKYADKLDSISIPSCNDLVKFFDTHDNVSRTINWQNLNGFESFEDLLYAYNNYSSTSKSKKDHDVVAQLKADKNFKIIHENYACVCALVLNHEGAKAADSSKIGGAGAKWCIGMSDSHYWNKYTDNHDIFVLAVRKNASLYGDQNRLKYMVQLSPDDTYIWNQQDNEVHSKIPAIDHFGMTLDELRKIAMKAARETPEYKHLFVKFSSTNVIFGEKYNSRIKLIDDTYGEDYDDVDWNIIIKEEQITRRPDTENEDGKVIVQINNGDELAATINSIPNYPKDVHAVHFMLPAGCDDTSLVEIHITNQQLIPRAPVVAESDEDWLHVNFIIPPELCSKANETLRNNRYHYGYCSVKAIVRDENDLQTLADQGSLGKVLLQLPNDFVELNDKHQKNTEYARVVVCDASKPYIPDFANAEKIYILGDKIKKCVASADAQIISKTPVSKISRIPLLRTIKWDSEAKWWKINENGNSKLFESALREVYAGNVSIHGERIYKSLANSGNMYRMANRPNFSTDFQREKLAKGTMTRLMKMFTLIILNPGRNRHEIDHAAFGDNGQISDTYNHMCDYFAWLSGEGYVAVTTKGKYYPTSKGVKKFIDLFGFDPDISKDDIVSYEALANDQHANTIRPKRSHLPAYLR